MSKVWGPKRLSTLEHWRFLDTWRDCLPWPCESHFIVKVFTDASNFWWGEVIQIPDKSPISVHDYWPGSARGYPIVVKEAHALVLTLQARKPFISTKRIWTAYNPYRRAYAKGSRPDYKKKGWNEMIRWHWTPRAWNWYAQGRRSAGDSFPPVFAMNAWKPYCPCEHQDGY